MSAEINGRPAADSTEHLPSITLPAISSGLHTVILSQNGNVMVRQKDNTLLLLDINANEIAYISCSQWIVVLKTDKTVCVWKNEIVETEGTLSELNPTTQREPTILTVNGLPIKFISISYYRDVIMGIKEDNKIYTLSHRGPNRTITEIQQPTINGQPIKATFIHATSEYTYVMIDKNGYAYINYWDYGCRCLSLNGEPVILSSVCCKDFIIIGVGFDKTVYVWEIRNLDACKVVDVDVGDENIEFRMESYYNNGYIIITESDGTVSYRDYKTGKKCAILGEEGEDVKLMYMKDGINPTDNVGITTDGKVIEWRWGQKGRYLLDNDGAHLNVMRDMMIKSAAREQRLLKG